MVVDILAIWENNRRKQEQAWKINITQPQPAWKQKEAYYANITDQPETKITVNPLDNQVEIGLGTRITPMTRWQKQKYADSLSDYQWNLMQRYKAEGYSFEASKELVNQTKELADPLAKGINKYRDYEAKENYYNQNGDVVWDNSKMGWAKTLLYATHPELGLSAVTDKTLNILKERTKKYEQRAEDEIVAFQDLKDQGQSTWKDRIADTLIKWSYGAIQGINKSIEAEEWWQDIMESGVQALLDRAILWYGTDLDFYRQTDRRLDEYVWEWISGWATTFFWIAGLPVMLWLTAIGNTEPGWLALDTIDSRLGGALNRTFDKFPMIRKYYNSLDEQGQEDMVDSIKDAIYYKVGKGTMKLKSNTTVGKKISATERIIKDSLKEWARAGKEQIKKEVSNVKNATDLYNEQWKKIWWYWPEWETGVGKSIGRVIDSAVKWFRENITRERGWKIAEPGAVETTTEEVVGKPNNESKWVVDRVKDTAQSTIDTIKTWLTPEERMRVVNDPYTIEKREKARTMLEEAGMPLEETFITEQLYNEIGDKILQVFDEWENKLTNTLPEYRALRNLSTTYNLIEATPLLTDLLLKNDITQDPVSWELDFSNSKFVSDADMRSVQRAIDMIYKDINTLVTPRQYLNLRDKLDQLAKYTTMDASRGQSLIRQIRHTLDWVAKKQIPGLKELDDTTSKYFKEIAELKDWWVYKESTRKGQVRNNFYSIIKNLTGHNRKVMLQRLEKYYPGIGEEIEAIHIVEKLVRAYNKSPQMIKALGIGWWFGWAIMWWNLISAFIGAILWEMIQKWLVEPGTKRWRRKAIDKLLSEMSPEAKAKLEEIALRQTYAKEMSAEDQKILEWVAEIIRQERERWLSEEAVREREARTRQIDNALPGIAPDIIDENGNITLGRWNVISPEKGPGRARRLTRINEINLRKPEITPDKQVLDLQEKLDIDTETAEDIRKSMDEFFEAIGWNEDGTIGWREVNYDKFSTKALEKLMDNDNLPRTEKDKIEEILVKRWAEEETMNEVEAERDFATRIKQLWEEEQRIGKVGKNKVSKEVADRQMRAWEKKKEALIKEIQDYYWIDQFEASDKYLDIESKWDQYIREYKRSDAYKTDKAEQEILDSLMEWWSKQPKFVRDMNESQLANRQEFINSVDLQNGYKLETTDYNDRYILEENGDIIDRGAIKYLDDWTIEVTAQTFDWIKESWLLDYLPDNTEIKEAGSDLWMSARELKGTPLSDTWIKDSEWEIVPISEVQNYYDFADKTPIDKFDGELTEQQIQEWKDLYQLASESLTPETENEIIEARGKFLTFNQRPGYTKALGLDQGEVNKTIMSWQRMSPELKKFVDKIHAKADPKYRFMWISNWIEKDNPWRWIDSLKFLTDDVKAVDKDPNIRSYELEIRDTLDGIMLWNSKLSYETLRIRLTHREERNAFNKELKDQKAVWEFFSNIDMLVAWKGKETVRHEEWHYISSLLWRKILWNNKAFDKWIRTATSRDWERWWDYRYKSPEVREFHEKILKLVESLDKSLTPEMKNDNRIMSDGIVMKDYRAKPDEKRARFWSASIEFTKKIAQIWKIPTKTFKSEHWDEYSLKQYENLLDILQEYQRLEDKWLFYEVEVPDETRVNKRTGLKDIQQQSLFDQEPETSKEEAKAEFDKEYDKLHNVLGRATGGTWIAPQRLPLSLNDTYTPDLKEWLRRMDEEDLDSRKWHFNEEILIDLYYAYLKMADNPKAMWLIRADKDEFHMKPYYELITKMKAQPLKIPEEFKNEQWLGPLRRALYELNGTTMEDLIDDYNPDIVEWAHNLKNWTVSKVTMPELTNINNLLENYIDNANLDIPVKWTFADEGINRLIDAVRNSRRYKSEISTYDQKQIRKIARETEDILDRRLEQLNMYYDQWLSENQDVKDIRADDWSDFKPQFIYWLAKAYDPNVDKRHKNIKKWFSENLKNYDWFKWVKQYEYLIEPHQLNSLKAKIKEFEKYSQDQINKVYGWTVTDTFFRYLEPKIKELQAKWTDKAVTDLIALSDMSVENFERQMKGFGGKSPMPSIAVQDPNVPSGSFGELTVLFGRETVDPDIDERNKLYGSDAWTPIFPSTKRRKGMEIDNPYKNEEIRPLVDDIISRGADIAPVEWEKLAYGIHDALTRRGNLGQLKKRRRDNNITAIKEYVEDLVFDAGEEAWIEWSNNEDAYHELAGQLFNLITGKWAVNTIDPNWRDYSEVKDIEEILSDIPEEDRKKRMEAFDKRMWHAYVEKTTNPEILARDIENEITKSSGVNIVALETKSDTFDNVISKMSDMIFKLKNATQVISTIYFDEKTSPRYMAVDWVAKWLADLMFDWDTTEKAVYEENVANFIKKNIHADSEKLYDSIQQYYWNFGDQWFLAKQLLRQLDNKEMWDRPLTPENVLEAMRWQKVNRETDPGSFRDMIEIEWTKVDSLEDVRKRNFAKVFHWDRVGELGDLENRYNNLLGIIQEIWFDNDIIHNTLAKKFIEKYNTQELIDKYNWDINKEKKDLIELLTTVNRNDKLDLIKKLADFGLRTSKDNPIGWVQEIIDSVDKEVSPIRTTIKESYNTDVKKFKANMKDHWYDIPDEVLQRLIDIVEQWRKIPIRFSESKPERVVDLMKEVKYVLVPKRQKSRVEKIVKGTPLEWKVVEYKEDNNIPYRTKKIKELQKKYWNIFFSMGWIVMPIAMLRMMMNGEDEGQA